MAIPREAYIELEKQYLLSGEDGRIIMDVTKKLYVLCSEDASLELLAEKLFGVLARLKEQKESIQNAAQQMYETLKGLEAQHKRMLDYQDDPMQTIDMAEDIQRDYATAIGVTKAAIRAAEGSE